MIAVYEIFKYLDACLKKNKGRVVFNGKFKFIDDDIFNDVDNGKFKFIDDVIFNDVDRAEWKDFYKDAHEEVPIKGPEPLGSPARLTVYIDANHAGNLRIRRSHSGILIFMNQSPIIVHVVVGIVAVVMYIEYKEDSYVE